MYEEREVWKCGRCLLDKDTECTCGWPFSFRDGPPKPCEEHHDG